MSIFNHRKKPCSVPTECVGMAVRLHSSICNGEKTIGFYNTETKKLMYAELVKGEADIADFCEKYGIDEKEITLR